jgi:hypothetical protein
MFDSELIPLEDFLYLHRDSPFATGVSFHLLDLKKNPSEGA